MKNHQSFPQRAMLALTAIICLAISDDAFGVFFDGNIDPNSQIGAVSNSIFVELLGTDGTIKYASGWMDGRYTAFTCAHNFNLNGVTHTVIGIGIGNYSNAAVFTNIAGTTIYPTWNGVQTFSTPDIAAIQLSSPAPFASPIPLPLGSVNASTTVTFSGYGLSGNTGIGYLAQDGNPHIGQANVESSAPQGLDSVIIGLPFGFYNDGASPNGAAAPGDSGGLVSLNGQAIGLLEGIVGEGQDIEDTLVGRLQYNGSNTDAGNFVISNVFLPQSLNMQVQGTNGIVSWSGLGILQAAASVNGSFSDVTNAINPYTFSITDTPQMFFRLRHN